MKNYYINLIITDWMNDQALSMCSPATRGIWIDLLCSMQLAGEPKLTGTIEQLSRLARCSPEEFSTAIDEIKKTKTANVTKSHTNVTIMSRRVEKDLKARENSKLRKRVERKNKQKKSPVTEMSHESHTNVTPQYSNNLLIYQSIKKIMSNSSSSRIYPREVILVENDDGDDVIMLTKRFLKWIEIFPEIDIFVELERITQLVMNNFKNIKNHEGYIYRLLEKANKEAKDAKVESDSGKLRLTPAGGIRGPEEKYG